MRLFLFCFGFLNFHDVVAAYFVQKERKGEGRRKIIKKKKGVIAQTMFLS